MNYLLIFGGRDFDDEASCALELQHASENWGLTPENTIVVEGGASGADAVGKSIAQELGFTVHTMKADWKDMSPPCRVKTNSHGEYNALAGFKRNSEMIDLATHAIGFWDGESKGTYDSISKIDKKGILFKLIEY